MVVPCRRQSRPRGTECLRRCLCCGGQHGRGHRRRVLTGTLLGGGGRQVTGWRCAMACLLDFSRRRRRPSLDAGITPPHKPLVITPRCACAPQSVGSMTGSTTPSGTKGKQGLTWDGCLQRRMHAAAAAASTLDGARVPAPVERCLHRLTLSCRRFLPHSSAGPESTYKENVLQGAGVKGMSDASGGGAGRALAVRLQCGSAEGCAGCMRCMGRICAPQRSRHHRCSYRVWCR